MFICHSSLLPGGQEKSKPYYDITGNDKGIELATIIHGSHDNKLDQHHQSCYQTCHIKLVEVLYTLLIEFTIAYTRIYMDVNYPAGSGGGIVPSPSAETIGWFTSALAEIFTAATVSAGAEKPQDTQENKL